MDPLAQLKDIHLPEQINNYPTAYGWWLLTALIIMICIWVIKTLIKKRQLEKTKKLAIKQISNNELESSEILSVMKWAAMRYFPRQKVANLFGEKLFTFYLERLPKKYHNVFSNVIETALTEQYKVSHSSSNNEIKEATLLWLTQALPPNIKVIEENTSSTNGQPQTNLTAEEVV